MSGDSSEEGILEEMDRVRGDLGGGIDRLGEQMRGLFDWQTYIRSAPLTSVAIAAAAGYLIAPRLRPRSVLVTANGAVPQPASAGLFGTIGNIVAAAATQAASLYIGNLLTQELTAMTMDPAAGPVADDAFDSNSDLEGYSPRGQD
ncbi:MAG: hypothetical protein V4719_25765 [Planctomycetota bacterium]